MFALETTFYESTNENINSLTLYFISQSDAEAAKDLLELADHKCLVREFENICVASSVKNAVDFAMNTLGFGYDPRNCPEWVSGVWG